MTLTLFDLDQTLLPLDCDIEWMHFLIGKGILPKKETSERGEEFMRQYHEGTLDMREYLAFQLRPLAEHPRPALEAWRKEFLRARIFPSIAPKALKLVQQNLKTRDHTLIISATNTFLAGPIARQFGVSDFLATRLEEREGRFTGRPSGTLCFREGKIQCLEEWLARKKIRWEDLSHTRFYSDSQNDLPLLSRVHEPIAVDPDPALRAHALRKGWSIISLL